MIWNTSGNSDASNTAGVISVSRTGSYRGNMSGISYNYTRVEEAKKHYDSNPALSKERKGRFPGNYSYRDFTFLFFLEKQGLPGYARPVTIGSALVEGDEMMADAAFSQHGAAEANKQRLLNVSYSLEYQVASANASLSANVSPPRLQRISAEGVYDIKTGSLCLVACQGTNGSSDDCDVLVTFQFAPVNSVEGERGIGTITSLRKKGDPRFFEAMYFVSSGMTVQQREQSSSRMDMESIMLVVSMTLSCVFTALQLRHVNKHPEALPATSVTMLVVLALGYVIPLVLNLEDMYTDTRRRYILQLTSAGSLDLNEFMLRASTVLALVLQLRLLQLALSRRSTDQAGSKHEDSSSSDAERSTLWICLPLYVLGAVVVWIVHMSDGHHLHGPRAGAFSISAPSGPSLVDDLAAYAGLILDGFLLPQVVYNALSGSRVTALSPWFYAGGTVIRAAPHVYDVFRKHNYVPSWNWKPTTYVYASPRDDLFGVAWDVAIPCGATLLAALLFLQQRLGGAFLCCLKSRRSGSGEYEMVSTTRISSE
jgi:ubiquitin-conjugating enzyme E2 O